MKILCSLMVVLILRQVSDIYCYCVISLFEYIGNQYSQSELLHYLTAYKITDKIAIFISQQYGSYKY